MPPMWNVISTMIGTACRPTRSSWSIAEVTRKVCGRLSVVAKAIPTEPSMLTIERSPAPARVIAWPVRTKTAVVSSGLCGWRVSGDRLSGRGEKVAIARRQSRHLGSSPHVGAIAYEAKDPYVSNASTPRISMLADGVAIRDESPSIRCSSFAAWSCPGAGRDAQAAIICNFNGRLAGHRDRAPNCKKIEMVVTAGLPAIDRRQCRVVGLS